MLHCMDVSTENEWQMMKSSPSALRKGQWGFERAQLNALDWRNIRCFTFWPHWVWGFLINWLLNTVNPNHSSLTFFLLFKILVPCFLLYISFPLLQITSKFSDWKQPTLIISQFLWVRNLGATYLGVSDSPEFGAGWGCHLLRRTEWRRIACKLTHVVVRRTQILMAVGLRALVHPGCWAEAAFRALEGGPPHSAARNMAAGFLQSECPRGNHCPVITSSQKGHPITSAIFRSSEVSESGPHSRGRDPTSTQRAGGKDHWGPCTGPLQTHLSSHHSICLL